MIALITGPALRYEIATTHGLYYPADMKITGTGAPLAVSQEHWQQDDYVFSWPGWAQRHPAGLVGWHCLDDTVPAEAAMLDAVRAGLVHWSTGPDATPAAAAARRAQPPAQPLRFAWPARKRHVAELAYTTRPADRGIPPLTVAATLPHQPPPAAALVPILYALWAIRG